MDKSLIILIVLCCMLCTTTIIFFIKHKLLSDKFYELLDDLKALGTASKNTLNEFTKVLTEFSYVIANSKEDINIDEFEISDELKVQMKKAVELIKAEFTKEE